MTHPVLLLGLILPQLTQEGEVAWILPEGRYPYWRGTLIPN